MRFPVLASALCLLALAGCAEPSSTSTLTVSGPAAEVERFVQAQTVSHPGLSVAEKSDAGSRQSEVTLSVTHPTTGQDLAEVSEEAIAARLSVAFKAGR